jgi:hypothetical protein
MTLPVLLALVVRSSGTHNGCLVQALFMGGGVPGEQASAGAHVSVGRIWSMILLYEDSGRRQR